MCLEVRMGFELSHLGICIQVFISSPLSDILRKLFMLYLPQGSPNSLLKKNKVLRRKRYFVMAENMPENNMWSLFKQLDWTCFITVNGYCVQRIFLGEKKQGVEVCRWVSMAGKAERNLQP